MRPTILTTTGQKGVLTLKTRECTISTIAIGIWANAAMCHSQLVSRDRNSSGENADAVVLIQ